ncbi:MAG: threonine--tRNA ligase [Candidatus Roizmanbacteria bacterium]
MSNLDQLRHSTAHLLASAVLEIWPNTKPTIGPSIENGFYYDFQFVEPISDKDLSRIEQKMRELSKKWESFERQELSEKEAKEYFKGNEYKLELLEEISKKGEKITVYKSGNFTDLCRGGHVEKPKEQLKHFKLLNLAGAYWRGDEKKSMLTRIYGTAFATKEELEKYLWQIEEAKKRDHKKLGKELDLFMFSELVGPGLPLWTPKGTIIRNLLDAYIWKLRKAKGFERVTIPHITKRDLYEKSGHWAKFSTELFRITSREGHEFAMKPMNCPHHTQIFAHLPRSYKQMPQRYAETTMVYRDEQTGELSGLSRVRSATQDDAHVFCRFNQIKDEVLAIWDIINTFYGTFGFELRIRLSMHDPANMSAYLGTEEKWERAESILKDLLIKRNAEYFEGIGEAAFYGPKLDFIGKDSMGRDHQVATIQLDINMPDQFDLYCTNEQGEQERVVMIHCAIMGSIERFMSVLIEHTAGNFPVWLAPVQIDILPVSDKHTEQAFKVHTILQNADIRSQLIDENKTLSYKIRESTLQKVPYIAIIGDKELEADNSNGAIVTLRKRDGSDQRQLPVSELIQIIQNHIENYQ